MGLQTKETTLGLDPSRRAAFSLIDVLRRFQGDAIASLGFAPNECAYRISTSGPFWRLRDYGGAQDAQPLLIIAAPIKRPYIWDLAPRASAIRRCMDSGLRVFLVEWMPATKETENNGVAEYIAAIRSCDTKVRAESFGARPFVMGHSLGGTLAAVFGAVAPAELQGLVLLGAPLCFGPETSRFRDALIKLVPSSLNDTGPCPGSLLSYASAMASPDAFIWSRFKDALVNFADPYALEMQTLVERWALDEVPLPGRLVHQIVDLFYRENLFCAGTLKIGGANVSPKNSSSPVLAVVNTADDVAPLASVLPFARAMHTKDIRIIEYSGEMGVGLQHLAFLIGRQAHAVLWPEILSWIDARRRARTT